MMVRIRPWWWVMGAAVLTIVLGALGWTLMPRGPAAWLGGPLQSGLMQRDNVANTQAQIAQLTEQVLQANAENALLRARLNDYLSIKGEGGFPPEQAVVVRAQIVARTVRLGRRYCEIDAGAVDGVMTGMAACLGWSFVGTVVGVQEGRALIQLITDSESRIPAALIGAEKMSAEKAGAEKSQQEKSEPEKVVAEGVLTGTGKRGLLFLDYIEDRRGLQLNLGQTVITAGTDGRIPAGLVLGTVTHATRSATADHWHIEVTPVREADTAESLLIIRFDSKPR
jgi:cell shape-determining protein MreC